MPVASFAPVRGSIIADVPVVDAGPVNGVAPAVPTVVPDDDEVLVDTAVVSVDDEVGPGVVTSKETRIQ